jgi:hypothetical protein
VYELNKGFAMIEIRRDLDGDQALLPFRPIFRKLQFAHISLKKGKELLLFGFYRLDIPTIVVGLV